MAAARIRATLLKRPATSAAAATGRWSRPRPRPRCASCCAWSSSTAPASSPTSPGYLVGGKTGTAEKAVAAAISANALLSSFVGVFPIDEPRYLVLVMLDEPHGDAETAGYATGGWIAAPAVGRIISRIGPMLGMPSVSNAEPMAGDWRAPAKVGRSADELPQRRRPPGAHRERHLRLTDRSWTSRRAGSARQPGAIPRSPA